MIKNNKLYPVFAGIILIAMMVSGCGKSETRDTGESLEDMVIPDTDYVVGQPEENTVADEKKAEEEPEGEKLVFRDLSGVEYETTINPRIAPKEYENESFFNNNGWLSYNNGDYLLGVDVSHHQGDIDWDKVKSAGFDFAFLRIGYRGYSTEGNINKDREFENYYKAARDAGLKVGVYFFSQAINEDEAREEADFVLNTLSGRRLELPVVYDPETITNDEARTDNVTGEQFTANTKAFCETITDNGYKAMIYTNMKWEAFELDLEQLSEYPIWYADYEPVPQTPYNFEIWQYSNQGSVPGISGACDLDIWIVKDGADDLITKDQALSAIKNYCFIQNPDLEKMVDSDDYTISWEVGSSGDQIVVLYRSYTGALIRYYIDPSSGDTYVTEYVSGITDEEEKTDESFNVRDYMKGE